MVARRGAKRTEVEVSAVVLTLGAMVLVVIDQMMTNVALMLFENSGGGAATPGLPR